MQIQVLGPFRLVGERRSVEIGGGQIRRLLAALLVAKGGEVSFDSLVHTLWGESASAAAPKSLRTYVTRLRRSFRSAGLDGDALRASGDGYILYVDTGIVDAYRFEELLAEARSSQDPRSSAALLTEALELWRGRAFGDMADDEAVRLEALRLEELRRVATEDLFGARLALGDHASLVPDLEEFVARHPLRERVWGQLMQALYRDGRQAEALDAYGRCRRILGVELGLEPSRDIQELEDAILTHTLETPSVTTSPALHAQSSRPVVGPVPAEVDSFVGRRREVEAVLSSLEKERLVTIVGVGGVGKTRLARRVAATVEFRDGVRWCGLSAVSTSAELLPAVVEAVAARIPPDARLEEGLLSFLHLREMLIVLDNCEHLLTPVSQLVDKLLNCPTITVLATSRAPLRMHGETLFPVDRLPLPSGDEYDAPAMELFLDRARAVRPDLPTSPAEREATAEICRRLDGLPLAIELAAARSRTLNPTDIAARLDRRFSLLADGSRTSPARHRSLRAAIDWSFGLLGTEERRLLARLSVFPGTFTLEAAEAVGGGEGIARDEVVDRIAGLVGQSLVVVDGAAGVTRYRLLETIRTYAAERLGEYPDSEEIRSRYVAFYLERSESADRGLEGADEALWVRRVKEDLHDFRHVFRSAVGRRETGTALRLTVALSRFARWRLHAETLEWAEQAVALPGARTHPLFPAASGAAGWAMALRGARPEAVELAEAGLEALETVSRDGVLPLEVLAHVALWEGRAEDCRRFREMADKLGDPVLTFTLTEVDSLACVYGGRLDDAWGLLETMEKVAELSGNPSDMSLVHYVRGEALMEVESSEAAYAFGSAMALAEEVDNRIVLGVAAASRGSQLVRHGEATAAIAPFVEVIDILWRAADWAHLWTALRSLVELLVKLEEHQVAALLHGAVLYASTSSPAFGADAERLRRLQSELQDRLGPEAVEELHRRGAAAPDDEIVTLARSTLMSLLAEVEGGRTAVG